MIWKVKPTLEEIKKMSTNTMVGMLGIEVIEIGDDYIKAKMPVDERTRQPMGLLHGGASVALSESIGSMASYYILDDVTKQSVVAIEINANHIRAVKDGFVQSVTRPVNLGRSLHIWLTNIFDDKERLICTSRLTVMLINNK